MILAIKNIALFAVKFPNFVSAKSVLHMKHPQIGEIGTGKCCGRTGKKAKITGKLKIEVKWGPCILFII